MIAAWRVSVEDGRQLGSRGWVAYGRLTAYREPRPGDPLRITLPTGVELAGTALAFEHYALLHWWTARSVACGVLVSPELGQVPPGTVLLSPQEIPMMNPDQFDDAVLRAVQACTRRDATPLKVSNLLPQTVQLAGSALTRQTDVEGSLARLEAAGRVAKAGPYWRAT